MKQPRISASRRITLLLRCALLAAVAAAGTTVLARLAWRAAAPAALALQQGGPTAVPALPFGDVLATLAALALLGCWVALVTQGAVVAVRVVWEVLRHGRPPSCWLGCPPGRQARTRRVVLAVLGLSLGAGTLAPATAAPPGRPAPDAVVAAARPLTGLPLPDRTAGTRAQAELPPRTVTVRRGDSLWSIAVSLAAAQNPSDRVAGCWQRLLRANADRLGDDPDLIFPGTSLVAPRCDRPRKDRP